jgi:hypothetical protein
MALQETKEQQKIYGFIQVLVYFLCVMDFAVLFSYKLGYEVINRFMSKLVQIPIFSDPLNTKLTIVLLISIVAIGTKAKKDLEMNVGKQIITPVIIGLFLLFGTLFILEMSVNKNISNIIYSFNVYELTYLGFTVLASFILSVGLDNISKLIKYNNKDRFNREEESFDQEENLVSTDTSINIPMLFYNKKKWRKGWININPFRGTIVIGTPGSGKSFGVINPTIRQMISKNFSMCIYDFKYPDLGKIAYYNWKEKKKKYPKYKHNFKVININDVEKSVRVNPLAKEYIKTLAEASDIAESIVFALQKGGSSSGGSEAFFTNSAINFLASCIYFFSKYEYDWIDKSNQKHSEVGKLSTLPHILAFMNKDYKEIFQTLFTNPELRSLLSPFYSAYKNEAFDQLEGQIGTIKILMSKLATKESFWVFGKNDINLKISDKNNPTVLILASDPNTQDINSAFYAVVLNRLLRLVNSKGNLPVGVIADEVPTLYIHKIDNVIATARSNKVAVMLGLQEIPQFKQFYKKEIADTIVSIVGNILSGSARNKETLDWLEKVFGKIKQKSTNLSMPDSGTTVSLNQKMDSLIPSGKIASLRTGEMVGVIAKERDKTPSKEYVSSAVNCRIDLDESEIKKEDKFIDRHKIPLHYTFEDANGNDHKAEILEKNFNKIYKQVDNLVIQCKKKYEEQQASKTKD